MEIITQEIKVYDHTDVVNDTDGIKSKVLEQLWDIEVNYDWWELPYEAFNEVLKGINGGTSETFYFDIDRGSFCSFEWSINSDEFMRFMESKDEFLKNYCDEDIVQIVNDWEEKLSNINKWAKYVSSKGLCHAYGSISHRSSTKSTTWDHDSTEGYLSDGANIEEELEKFAEFLQEVCKDLSNYFLNCLRNDYDYRTSEECILESIEANEYKFTADGKIY